MVRLLMAALAAFYPKTRDVGGTAGLMRTVDDLRARAEIRRLFTWAVGEAAQGGPHGAGSWGRIALIGRGADAGSALVTAVASYDGAVITGARFILRGDHPFRSAAERAIGGRSAVDHSAGLASLRAALLTSGDEDGDSTVPAATVLIAAADTLDRDGVRDAVGALLESGGTFSGGSVLLMLHSAGDWRVADAVEAAGLEGRVTPLPTGDACTAVILRRPERFEAGGAGVV